MKADIAITALLLLTLCACHKDDTSVGVELRIFNDSAFPLDAVRLQVKNAASLHYANLAPSTYSGYQSAPFTYSLADVQAIIGTDTLRLQPLDYVGAQRYERGRYTYRLVISGERQPGGMLLEFVAE